MEAVVAVMPVPPNVMPPYVDVRLTEVAEMLLSTARFSAAPVVVIWMVLPVEDVTVSETADGVPEKESVTVILPDIPSDRVGAPEAAVTVPVDVPASVRDVVLESLM